MKIVLSCLMLTATLLLSGKEMELMKNGSPVCSIVLRKDAGEPEKLAAKELSLYLGKIANGKAPLISAAPVKGKYPIYLELTKDPKVSRDGFKITANQKALRIAGREGVGVLYGVYDILRRYGGIRWLFPGKDGEYFKTRSTISIPEGSRIKNPDFTTRHFSLVCMNWYSKIPDTLAWSSRNFMRFRDNPSRLRHKKIGTVRRERGLLCAIGSHCFSPLLVYNPNCKTPKERKDYQQKLFREHPEYFPLINGKRVPSFHGGAVPQPCTTNKDVIRIVANSIIHQYKNAPKPVVLSFGNNDTTQWCQCANCKKVDPPAETAAGIISTRYWTFANAVMELVKKEVPDLIFEGWSYQNYSRVPVGVQPDKRVQTVMVSNHRRCWKHALNDKDCPTNGWYYEYNKEWNDRKVPFYSYDELISAGQNFLPNEKPWVDALKYYKKNMPYFTGTCTEICCPDGEYGKRWKSFKTLNNWYMMWQAVYLAANFHWDIDGDYDKMYEEINSLYYGKGWEGGMREFRKLLTSLYMNAGGCWGYAHSIPVGKFLDVPGARENLEKYLDSAEKAAAKDPDPRALAHVKRDRVFFNVTWVKAYNDYIKNFREIKLYPLMGKITIDGKLDEKDWKNADVTTNFYTVKGTRAKYQTAVKLAYDKEFLYVGVESLDPEVNKVYSYTKKQDGEAWLDNGVELFLNDPIQGAAYYQIIINSDGYITDGIANPRFDMKWHSGTVVKTRKEKDRWFLEARIPARNITGSLFTAGTMLRMNVMRHRVIAGDKTKNETSTWSMGYPHNVEVFHPINFAAPRTVTPGNRHEVDTRFWRNGSLNEVAPKSRIPKKWKAKSKHLPRFWGLSGGNYFGEYDYKLHPGSKTNYYVSFSGGFLSNSTKIRTPKIAMTLRLRGKGVMWVAMLRYTKGYKKSLRTKLMHTIKADSSDWKTYTFTVDRPGSVEEEQTVIFWPRTKGAIFDIDDIFLAPREK